MWNQPSRRAPRRSPRVVPVAAKHVDAARRAPRRRRRSGRRRRAAAGRRCRSCLRPGVFTVGRRGVSVRPVALEDGDADAAEEVAEPGAERSAAGDRVLARGRRARRAACRRPAGRRRACCGPQRQARAARCPAPRCRRSRVSAAPVEDLALAVGLRLGLGGVVDLLEDPRHGQDEGRPERGQVVDQVLDVGGVAQPTRASRRSADLDQPGEDVRQRQEEQGASAVGADDARQPGDGVARVGGSCAWVSSQPLGRPVVPRGVDRWWRRLSAVSGRAAALDLLVGDGRPPAASVVRAPPARSARRARSAGSRRAPAPRSPRAPRSRRPRPTAPESDEDPGDLLGARRSRRSARSPRRRTRSRSRSASTRSGSATSAPTRSPGLRRRRRPGPWRPG